METFLLIMKFLGFGLLGILFHTVFKSARHFAEWKPFSNPLNIKKKEGGSIARMINENFGKWVWCSLIVILVDVVVVFVPDVAESISSLTAIDFTGNDAGFFVFGAGLSGFIKRKKNAG